MRAAPPPRRAMRSLRSAVRGAVQPSSAPPSSAVMNRQFGRATTATAVHERRYLAEYQGWQFDARRAARTSGIARFAANMVAATAARVTLHVEERNDRGDWNETEQARFGDLMGLYRNDTLGQGPAELVRLHTFHYQVSGEGCILNRDVDSGQAEWLVSSIPSVQFGVPGPDYATINLVPAGQVLDGTAFVVPRDQIMHFWMPDEDWLALAVSPMTAAMDDLKRYESLARHARRQANNYLAQNGALWTPSAAHERENDAAGPDADPDGPSPLLQAYEEMSRVSLNDFDDGTLEAVIPPMWWWDGEKPEWVEIGRPLDEHGPAYRTEALGDFARDLDVPAALVTGGGTDQEGNHWQSWMTKDRFLGTVAPTLDRVTHQDLTVTFLHPMLRLDGVHDVSRYRVGYDASDVIKSPDESDKALRAWLAGLLGAKPTLEKMGFEPDELAGPEDLARLAAVLSNFGNGVPDITRSDGPAGPGTVVEGPPTAAALLRAYLPREHVTVANGDARDAAMSAAAKFVQRRAQRAAALNPAGTGVMVSLDVPRDVANTIALPDGEPADAMHVTLVHLAREAADERPELRDVLAGAARQVAEATAAPTVNLTHVERFVASEEGLEPVVLVDDGPEVYALREKLVAILDEQQVPYSDDHGFRCHVTVGYWPPGEGPGAGPLTTPVPFVPVGVTLHWGKDIVSYPFGGTAATEELAAGIVVGSPEAVVASAESERLRAETGKMLRRHVARAEKQLRRLARVRRDAGRELLSAAELAFSEALRQAGVRAETRARNRSGKGLGDSVAAAVEQGVSLRPFFAQLGVNEDRLFAGAFESFQRQAERTLAQAQTEQQEADGGEARDDHTAEAAAFLAAVLLALARSRILAGTDPKTLDGPGEVSGDVPAGYVEQALGVADGRYAVVPSGTPDVAPGIARTGVDAPEAKISRGLKDDLTGTLRAELGATTTSRRRVTLERALAMVAETDQTRYRWTWGFWASPKREFAPHRRLDGHISVDPEHDTAYANPGPWPDPGVWPYYQPSDHLGCSCEQVSQVASETVDLVGSLA